MSKVAIVTDSTAYLPKPLVDQYHITVAPQILIWDQVTFQDGVDIQPVEFYQRLKTAKVMPSSSQVAIPTVRAIYSSLLDQGYSILALLISAKLSGTIDSAVQARDGFPQAPIEIVDTCTTGLEMGLHVLAAARAAEAGASLAECKAVAEEAKKHSHIYITVETLEFLHRGGRIGGAQRFLGTALNIKPILDIRDGRLEAVERVRTRGKALTRLIELVEADVDGKKPIHLACMHANAEAEARSVLYQAESRLGKVEETILGDVSPVIGTHAGPGTIGLAYLVEM
jgi:DegV family protein with EDD domain